MLTAYFIVFMISHILTLYFIIIEKFHCIYSHLECIRIKEYGVCEIDVPSLDVGHNSSETKDFVLVAVPIIGGTDITVGQWNRSTTSFVTDVKIHCGVVYNLDGKVNIE